MNDAFDTIRIHRIEANRATDSAFPGRYICPLCKTAVSYVSGPSMVPHFRHMRGRDHDDCERYARSFHATVTFSRFETDQHDAVLVAKEISEGIKSSVMFFVRFRPAYKVNYINLLSGDSSVPYTIHAGVRQQYFRVNSVEDTYVIKAFGPESGSETHLVEGFGGAPLVFRLSEAESVRLPSHRLLKPGDYLVASQTDLSRRFDSALQAREADTIEGIFVAKITIPVDPNGKIRENVRSLLRFEISSRLAEYAFLKPTNVTEVAPDCWEVDSEAELNLYIKLLGNGAFRPNRLFIQRRVGGHLTSETLTVPNERRNLAVIAGPGQDRPELFRIGISDPPQFLVEVAFTQEMVSPASARLNFCFLLKDGMSKRIPWSSHALSPLLLGAVAGTIILKSIEVPRSVILSIADSAGRRQILSGVSDASDVLGFIRKARFPISISASGYATLVLRKRTRRIDRPSTARQERSFEATSVRGARFLAAFERSKVSLYAVQTICS